MLEFRWTFNSSSQSPEFLSLPPSQYSSKEDLPGSSILRFHVLRSDVGSGETTVTQLLRLNELKYIYICFLWIRAIPLCLVWMIFISRQNTILPKIGRKGVLWYNNMLLDVGAKSKAILFILCVTILAKGLVFKSFIGLVVIIEAHWVPRNFWIL